MLTASTTERFDAESALHVPGADTVHVVLFKLVVTRVLQVSSFTGCTEAACKNDGHLQLQHVSYILNQH